jgi:hypothetical protein
MWDVDKSPASGDQFGRQDSSRGGFINSRRKMNWERYADGLKMSALSKQRSVQPEVTWRSEEEEKYKIRRKGKNNLHVMNRCRDMKRSSLVTVTPWQVVTKWTVWRASHMKINDCKVQASKLSRPADVNRAASLGPDVVLCGQTDYRYWVQNPYRPV